MTVFAVMRDGREVPLAPKHGSTPEDVVRSLTSETLTGSAVPLADAELEAVDGKTVRYADVNAFATKAPTAEQRR